MNARRLSQALIVAAALTWAAAPGLLLSGEGDCNDNGIPDVFEVEPAFFEHALAGGEHGTETADFDGDGDLDLLTDRVGWMENVDGSGLLWVGHVILDSPAHAVPADVDGDGDPDVVAAIAATEELVWFENTGAGNFGPPVQINDQIQAAAIAAADLDGDGDPDVLRAHTSPDALDWYENLDGQGGFGPARVVSLDGHPSAVSAADVDRDGDLDLFAAFQHDAHLVGWYENLDGQGSFGPREVIAGVDEPHEVVPADIDGDGWIDLLTASTWSDYVAWFRNQGDGTFGSLQSVPLDVEEPNVAAGDLDGDGDLDVVGTKRYAGKVSWSENLDGLGTFGPGQTLTLAAPYAGHVAAADLDGDGDRDVIFERQSGTGWIENASADCDANGVPDDCDVASGTAADCDASGHPDPCEVSTGAAPDCNLTGVPDACDVAGGASADCNANGIPDECEPDCNLNGAPDECDIAAGTSDDCTAGGVPDECEPDCNLNSQADSCDIAGEISDDADGSGVPDECEPDCNGNGIVDAADLGLGTSTDCNANGVPDECDVAAGTSEDCDADGAPDECALEVSFAEHPIAQGIGGLRAAAAGDLDGDGDLDSVTGSTVDGKVRWYENVDGTGAFGPGQILSATPILATILLVADIDGDGDDDILACGQLTVVWFENVGEGSDFVGHYIETNKPITRIYPGDLDGDEDLDVAYASHEDHEVGWYENPAGSGTVWSPPVALTDSIFDIFHASSVLVADLDGDLDGDVLAGGATGLSWFENTGAGTFSEALLLSGSAGFPLHLEAADMDGDDDLDILSVSYYNERTGWFPQLSDGVLGAERLVGSSGMPRQAASADFDGDGDLDVAVASEDEGTVSWFENLDGAGTFGPQRIITSDAAGAQAVVAADLDGDSLPDVLSAAEDADRLSWHENLGGDCNVNGMPDGCDVGGGTSADCDADLAPDECQADCDGDGVPDACEADCDGDGRPDKCELAGGASDCNLNGVPDGCDVAGGASADCGGNGVPDECEPDCNGNGVEDGCDIASGTSADCPGAGNGVPDECEPDCNGNGQADGCDLTVGTSADCDGTGVPDECELDSDCDGNLVPDECDVDFGFVAVPVAVALANPRGLHAADLDGDGLLEVLSATSNDDTIAWYALAPGGGSFGPRHVITALADGARGVTAADLDGDSDVDVVSASYNDGRIAWYQNLDGAGTFGPLKPITTTAGAQSVSAADVDGDGDFDVVSASALANAIRWFENEGGAFLPRLISSVALGASSVAAADVDGDGDVDILSTSVNDDKVAWYENMDGQGTFGSPRVISTWAESARAVAAADVDGDGDVDVLVAADGAGTVSWYENTTGEGDFHPGTTIAPGLASARGVAAIDVEGDGDLDVVWTSLALVGYNENLDGHGTFGPVRTLGPTSDSWAVLATDLNADANADFVSASSGFEQIVWHRNRHSDCDADGIPDGCEADCEGDGIPDACDLRLGWSPDCDGNTVPDGCDTGCSGSCDADGDGCYDGVDDEPANPAACNDGDGDGCDDCSGGFLDPGEDGPDGDEDGACDAGDCAIADAAVWSDPGPVSTLRVDGSNPTQLLWQPPAHPGALWPSYDTLRSPAPSDFAGAATCLETGEADTVAEDGSAPPAGAVWHYLIRVTNGCPGGAGSMGTDSAGTPRSGPVCP